MKTLNGNRHPGIGRAVMSLLAAAMSWFLPSAGMARSVDALLLTDVHFDPFVDAETVQRLRDAPSGDWRAILGGRQGALSFPACGESAPTTDMGLLASAIDEIGSHRTGFTVLGGDLLVHEFQCRFRSLFPDADEAAYLEFAARTVEFVLSEVRHATHGAPVYLAPGNHDSGCGNYRRDDHDLFLRRIAPAVARAAGGAEQTSIISSFAEFGRYRVTAPRPLKNLTLLIVDTSLWSNRALTCAGQARSDDAGQLAWLRDQLMALKEADRAVWMVGHIPPGLDPRASALSGKPVRYLRDDAVALSLAEAPRPLDLALFGHTHMDEWRLFGAVPVRISPALSPSSGNRPALTIARIADDGSLRDYTVLSYRKEQQIWSQDHGLSASFDFTGFNADNLSRINRGMIRENAKYSIKYNENYSSGGDVKMPNSKDWMAAQACAISSITQDEFLRCRETHYKGK